MSAEAIARWNAIPLMRPDLDPQSVAHPSKRTRDEVDENESDDDVPLVSRSPSPQPAPDAMDIDKYDEYVRGPARETVTVETKIKSSNKGFLMLANMGWVEGQPLGLSGEGRVDPVPFYVKNDLTGLGKTNQDIRMIETTVSQRRELDSERQTKETEEQRKAREDSVAKRAAVQSEISTTLRAFYCELCEKQFQNVAQYDEHTNSYAHHHKARFREMQLAQRANRNTQEEIEKRKEKERKREEKELRKIAKAAGVKMAKPPVTLVTPMPQSNVLNTGAPAPGGSDSNSNAESEPGVFKKSGWATVGVSSAPNPTALDTSSPSASTAGRSGWAAVGTTPALAPEPPAPDSGGWASVSSHTQPAAPPSNMSTSTDYALRASSSFASTPAPAFRTGGWTSLDTGSTLLPPPAPSHSPGPPLTTPPPVASFAPPPPPASTPLPPMSMRNFTAPSGPGPVHNSGWLSAASNSASQPPRGGWQRLSTPHAPVFPSSGVPASISQPVPGPPRSIGAGPARQEATRSGWQQFHAGGKGKRK